MEIRKFARLAYIELDAEEEKRLQQDVQQAVAWMEALQGFCEAQPQECASVSEAHPQPSALHPQPMDAASMALVSNAPLEAISANAPRMSQHCFAVPKVIA